MSGQMSVVPTCPRLSGIHHYVMQRVVLNIFGGNIIRVNNLQVKIISIKEDVTSLLPVH